MMLERFLYFGVQAGTKAHESRGHGSIDYVTRFRYKKHPLNDALRSRQQLRARSSTRQRASAGRSRAEEPLPFPLRKAPSRPDVRITKRTRCKQ